MVSPAGAVQSDGRPIERAGSGYTSALIVSIRQSNGELTEKNDMKPSPRDVRTARLTLEQYLGLADGMSLKVAGRMLTLAGDYTNDVIDYHEDALDPRHDRASLTGLARAATRAETELARLLVLAAEHCADAALMDVPFAIRSSMKTASRCRSSICEMALMAEQHGFGEQLAA